MTVGTHIHYHSVSLYDSACMLYCQTIMFNNPLGIQLSRFLSSHVLMSSLVSSWIHRSVITNDASKRSSRTSHRISSSRTTRSPQLVLPTGTVNTNESCPHMGSTETMGSFHNRPTPSHMQIYCLLFVNGTEASMIIAYNDLRILRTLKALSCGHLARKNDRPMALSSSMAPTCPAVKSVKLKLSSLYLSSRSLEAVRKRIKAESSKIEHVLQVALVQIHYLRFFSCFSAPEQTTNASLNPGSNRAPEGSGGLSTPKNRCTPLLLARWSSTTVLRGDVDPLFGGRRVARCAGGCEDATPVDA